MNQSFTKQQLNKHCRDLEFFEYGGAALLNALEQTSEKINNGAFNFEIKRTNDYFLCNDLPNKLVLRKLNDNIKRLYKDEQSNRRLIIAQVKTLLEETCPFWLIKADVKGFYENINRAWLLGKLRDDSILSYQSLELLKNVFNNPTITPPKGVPRGLNVSSTLSEMYMRKFDKWIRRVPGVYYYARFVDDMVIFLNSKQSALDILHVINAKLSELATGLTLNDGKTQLFDGMTLRPLNKSNGLKIQSATTFEYLGYKFTRGRVEGKNVLKIAIADKKVKKIKTRLALSFLSYRRDKNFSLLENRIKFLTGNYTVRKDADGNALRAGIYYNYLQVNDLSILTDLNIYFRKILFSHNKSFGVKLSSNLSVAQKSKLNKYCFKIGFALKIHNSFTFDQMKQIISCW